ncbi:inhibin beta C chain [Bemisia tabaci]|uniref:inhibin beta C chain n=1 Tax=Bemisia tabaci TaxID=7038 RepID=UPI003B2860FB
MVDPRQPLVAALAMVLFANLGSAVLGTGNSVLGTGSAMIGPGNVHDRTTCPRCALHRQALEASLSEAELASSRVEYIKQQILKKLRLKEPPLVKRRASVPAHAFQTQPPPDRPEDEFEDDGDDFYGKTGRIVLFPLQEENECPSFGANGTSTDCSTYELPGQAVDEHVVSAVLWIHIVFEQQTRPNLENEISIDLSFDNRGDHQFTYNYQSSSLTDGWMKIDLVPQVRRWLEEGDLTHHIKTTCKNCEPDVKISSDHDSRPFLILNTEPMNRTRRLKRNVSCAPGIKECCREGLYLSFKDIGWSNWIIYPNGYQAYFCKGSCSEATSLTVSGSHYTTIVQRLLHTTPRTQNLGLVPCCTATKLSSMTLLYMDKDNSWTEKIIPNMIVESCGCM